MGFGNFFKELDDDIDDVFEFLSDPLNLRNERGRGKGNDRGRDDRDRGRGGRR